MCTESFIDASDGDVSKRYAVAALLEQFAWVAAIGDVRSRRMALEQIVSGLLESELRAAEQAERAAEHAERAAERAAERLQSICNLISAAPTRARSTSSSRSSAPDTVAAAPATQQTDDDDDGVVVTADQVRAAEMAAKAAVSRIGGAEFGDFVGKWSMPSSDDAAWRATADQMLNRFQAMLSAPISGWKRHANDTVQTRLNQLVEFRTQGASARNAASFPREFETKVTHPFVFAVLKEAAPQLQTLLPHATLHLYTENVGKIANKLMYRNADAILFGDTETNVPILDARARRDALVAIEAERWLNSQGQADALVGGERDFVIVSGDVPVDQMRVGTSVFTDGVEWYFARIAWRYSTKWTRDIKISPAINVNAASDGWQQLARWFALAFHDAVTRPRELTGLSRITWTVAGSAAWHLVDVMSCGKRSIVSRWQTQVEAADGTVLPADAVTHFQPVCKTAVVKFAVGRDDDNGARLREVQRYFAHEREMLRKFAAQPSFVHIDALFPVVDGTYVALEDGGVALASFNIRGAAGRELAVLVREHIWLGALAALKEHNLCHFDITENNIVVSADRGGAKLIDLESVTGVGQSAAASPTAAIKGVRPAVASVAFDEQCVCAILRCLWDAEIASFEERSSFVAQFGADELRRGLVEQIRSAQV
jgi:hypothetical protein